MRFGATFLRKSTSRLTDIDVVIEHMQREAGTTLRKSLSFCAKIFVA